MFFVKVVTKSIIRLGFCNTCSKYLLHFDRLLNESSYTTVNYFILQQTSTFTDTLCRRIKNTFISQTHILHFTTTNLSTAMFKYEWNYYVVASLKMYSKHWVYRHFDLKATCIIHSRCLTWHLNKTSRVALLQKGFQRNNLKLIPYLYCTSSLQMP